MKGKEIIIVDHLGMYGEVRQDRESPFRLISATRSRAKHLRLWGRGCEGVFRTKLHTKKGKMKRKSKLFNSWGRGFTAPLHFCGRCLPQATRSRSIQHSSLFDLKTEIRIETTCLKNLIFIDIQYLHRYRFRISF